MAIPKIPRGKAEPKPSTEDQEPAEEESAKVSTSSPRRRTKTASPPENEAEPSQTAKSRQKTSTKPGRANSRDSARAAPPHLRRAVLQPRGRNRLLRTLDQVSLSNKSALNAVISKVPHTSVELAPAFQEICSRNRNMGARLAEAYAESISDPLQHRELFQQAAAMTGVERKILIAGYKRAGQARGVVHAIGQLPRAQGRVLMRDFVLKPDESVDKSSLREVLYWLRDAGATRKVARKTAITALTSGCTCYREPVLQR